MLEYLLIYLAAIVLPCAVFVGGGYLIWYLFYRKK